MGTGGTADTLMSATHPEILRAGLHNGRSYFWSIAFTGAKNLSDPTR